MNGYTEKIYKSLMPFTGKVKNGIAVEGKRKLDERGLIHLLGNFESRISNLELELKNHYDKKKTKRGWKW